MSPGQKLVAVFKTFDGKNVKEQINKAFAAQREFGDWWEKCKQEVADNKSKMYNPCA